MRITHTDRSEVKISSFRYDMADSFFYWNLVIVDDRGSHINSDILTIGSQYYDAPRCIYSDFVLFCESSVPDILHKATSSVATHLYLSTILIKYPITKVCFFRLFYYEYLITSNSELAMSELLCEFLGYYYLRMTYTIEYNEVIAEPMHLGEGNSHKKYVKKI
jgi:hypothetical protein